MVPLLTLLKAAVSGGGSHAHTGAVVFGPELVLWAFLGSANAVANILVPDSSGGAHDGAALAFTVIEVPDLHVTAVLGHAEALAAGVVPELIWFAISLRDANEFAVLSRPVSTEGISGLFICLITFASASLGIVILNFGARIWAAFTIVSWVALTSTSFLVPVLVDITCVTLLVAFAFAVSNIPVEAWLALAGGAAALAGLGIEVLVGRASGH